MTKQKTTMTKSEIRKIMHPTRPPRLEGSMSKAKHERKKAKVSRVKAAMPQKRQGVSEQMRKDYQLPSRRR